MHTPTTEMKHVQEHHINLVLKTKSDMIIIKSRADNLSLALSDSCSKIQPVTTLPDIFRTAASTLPAVNTCIKGTFSAAPTLPHPRFFASTRFYLFSPYPTSGMTPTRTFVAEDLAAHDGVALSWR